MSQDDTPLTLIGIGSSAGGLEAIRDLVASLPPDLPVSYVVVQHMAPHHKSLMTELVSRSTQMKVVNVEDGITPQANVMYITPPNTDVEFADGVLCLRPPSTDPGHPKPSINRFLLSLAENHGAPSMGIILSGTGSDGAYGVQAIREAGGITIAQESESAKYDAMPNAAIQTGCVDLILTPSQIGESLGRILTSPKDLPFFRTDAFQATPHSDLLQILLARTRVDFREYKQTTVSRRIERRMLALGISDIEAYTQHCRAHPEAIDALFKDLLISVTRFFRDAEEFEQLGKMLPQMIRDSDGDQLRVWIAGCATGEEAYSIAMMFADAMDNGDTKGGAALGNFSNRVQIFATDIDRNALQVARRGVYPVDALKNIPPHLAEQYVIRQGEDIRIVDSLRKSILFSDHNVCQEPPFQRVDLVCCRNLMIYFETSLQQKVVSRFHYALKPRGYLFLGTAEALSGAEDLFATRATAAHIYRKRLLRADTPVIYAGHETKRMVQPRIRTEAPAPSTDRRLFEALALSLGQNSILVTDDFTIGRVFGDVSEYIEVNEISKLKMHLSLLRSPLREEARSLVTIALKSRMNRSGVRHLLNQDAENEVRLDVYPIIADDINERAALVVFTPIKVEPARPPATIDPQDGNEAQHQRIQFLESEVETTREALQQTIEELETSNEEMQSLNEEMQSTNEELQATNEELETSNEELQSTNEELITVNEELQVTAAELSGRTGELMSVLKSTPLAIIVMDTALQIIQVTEPAVSLFQIGRPVVGQHISQCVLPEGFPKLAPPCGEALHLGETVNSEFTSGANLIRLSCAPYFDTNGQVQGVTMVVDELPGLAREMELILNTNHIHLMERDVKGRILQISEGSARTLGTTRKKALGKKLSTLMKHQDAQNILDADAAFLANNQSHAFEVVRIEHGPGAAPSWIRVDRHAFSRTSNDDASIISVGLDITETVQARDAARDTILQMQRLQDFAGVGYWEVDVAAQKVFWTAEVYRIHRIDPKTYSPDLRSALAHYHPEDVAAVTSHVSAVSEKGGEFHFIKRLVGADGAIVPVEAHGLANTDDTGKVVRISGFFRELTGKSYHEAEAELDMELLNGQAVRLGEAPKIASITTEDSAEAVAGEAKD